MSKKKFQKSHQNTNQDWKKQLSSIKSDMIENMSEEEKAAYQREQQDKAIRRKKLNRLKP